MNRSRLISPNPDGLATGRFITSGLIGKNANSAYLYAERQDWKTSPEVAMQLRAVTDPLDSGTSLSFGYVEPDFLALLSKVSAFEQFRPLCLETAFLTKTPFESVAPTGDFVGETGGLPVVAPTLGSATFSQTKIGNIVVVTNELVRNSSPSTALVIPRMTANALAYTTDQKFFDTSAEIVGKRPAGICASGAGSIASTGSTAAAIATDLASMIAALTVPWRSVVFCLKQSTFAAIGARIPTAIGFNGDRPTLLGIPAYFSLAVGAKIVLFDAESVIIAAGETSIDISNQASLEMSNATLSGEESPLVPTSTVIKSLFANGLQAFKIERFINWKRTSDAAVCSLSVNY